MSIRFRRSRQGCDVATYQGPPGQWRPEIGRMGWAAVKMTELSAAGAYENPDAPADWAFLRSRGKGRVAYLYGHPGQGVTETVHLFATVIARLGLEDDDAVAVDLEETGGRTPEQVAAWAGQVLAALADLYKRTPLLYTYVDFAYAGNCAGLGKYPLWISNPSRPPGQPQVPPPWKTWAIHQWSITSPLDRDLIAYATVEEMGRALGKTGRPPAKKHRARHAARAVGSATSAAASASVKAARQEPVLTSGSAAGLLAAAVVFLQHHVGLHLTVTELRALITALAAAAGGIPALAARPVRVTAITTALGTGAAAAAAFGLHLPPQVLGASAPLAALLVSLLVRGHVTPVTADPPAPQVAPPVS